MCVSSLVVIGLSLPPHSYPALTHAQTITPNLIDAPQVFLDGLGGESLKIIPSGAVKRVISGTSLELESGLIVRLVGIDAPKRNRDAETDKALYEQAKTALQERVKDQSLGLAYTGPERDRYGRALAQVFTLGPDGKAERWLQGELVASGFARVHSWADSAFKTDYLYGLEEAARRSKRGVWANPTFKIRTPDPNNLAQDVDSFQIVEGIVISAADVRGRVYLNFGSDYKTDFTVTIDKKYRKKFEAAGLDLLALEGARIRVRGWVELYNGPVIWIDHPERLELLDG